MRGDRDRQRDEYRPEEATTTTGASKTMRDRGSMRRPLPIGVRAELATTVAPTTTTATMPAAAAVATPVGPFPTGQPSRSVGSSPAPERA